MNEQQKDAIVEMVEAIKCAVEDMGKLDNEYDRTPKLGEAIAKAQAEIKPPVKNRNVDFVPKDGGPRVKYSYADLSDVIEAYKGPLSKNGLSIIHSMEYTKQGKFGLKTTLLHSSGESRSTWYPLPDPTNMKPQTFGSALTYARRYSASALIGIASEEDDDGQGAAAGMTHEKKPPAKKPEPKPAPAKPADQKAPNLAPASNAEKKRIAAVLKERGISIGVFKKWTQCCWGTADVENIRAEHVDPMMEVLQDDTTNEAVLMAQVARAQQDRQMDQRPEAEQPRFAPGNA